MKKILPSGFDVHLVATDVTVADVQGDSGVSPGASLDESRQVAILPPFVSLLDESKGGWGWGLVDTAGTNGPLAPRTRGIVFTSEIVHK